MVLPAPRGFSEAEYLALEAAGETRHEFVGGAIVSMAGAEPAHHILSANATALLAALIKGKACVVMSDQRVHVPATGLYAYPDATVVCGDRRYKDTRPASLINPTLLVEVTTDTTEDFDRGSKFVHYQSIGLEPARDALIPPGAWEAQPQPSFIGRKTETPPCTLPEWPLGCRSRRTTSPSRPPSSQS